MTQLEKQIYNTYLAVMRSSQNKPFTIRKNFDDFEESEQYPYVKKISNVFKKLPHINMNRYFEAPYKVYPNDPDKIYGLDFYSSLKAIACYKQYVKLKEMEDPDTPDQIQFIVDSFRFILKFCCENKIPFEKYLDYKVGFTPEWMKHYTEQKISLYCLLDIPNIYDRIMSINGDHRKLLLGDLENRFHIIKDKFLKSKKTKILVKRGIELLNQKTK